MARVDLRNIVSRLNPACHMALEEAASICVSAGHREVAIEHLLVAMLAQPGTDLRMILQGIGQDPDDLKTKIEASFERFRPGEGNPPVFSPQLSELLQESWLIASIELGEAAIRGGSILLAILQDLGRFSRFEYATTLDRLPRERILKTFPDMTRGSVETPRGGSAAANKRSSTPGEGLAGSESALAKYAQCFTEQARQGKIDPVFCRDGEIHQIIDILTRRRKNNPICVGEAGVGKTAVVEGLALRIVNADVPDLLKDAELYGLDLGALQAGASVKGEFEKRLKAVLDEIRNAETPTILFIDEAHTLIGAGGQAGGSDAANLLKPALARGEIKTIAATTWSEYKKYFEKDPALTRRFQLVKLDEPSVEDTCTILLGLVSAYEKAHGGVYISHDGVRAAVELSARYITGRQLPDKAIDVLDTACARVHAAATSTPQSIDHLERSVLALERERDTLERDLDAGHDENRLSLRVAEIDNTLADLRATKAELEAEHGRQQALADRLKSLRGQTTDVADRAELARTRIAFEDSRKHRPLTSLEVGPIEVASVISDWTGIPVSSMRQDELKSLVSLARTMGGTIKGQDHALELLEQQLQAAKLDLHRAGRPMGVFLLVGPSGVGKTETALEIGRRLFGGEAFVTTVNMTEFQEKHSLSRLIGSPPGYVGYGEGGVLTEAIRKKPYSVVLLDEVEKADPDVLNLFYQAFDKGVLCDGEGREIDCKNVVFFLASNLAAEQIIHFASLESPMTPEEIAEEIQPILAAHFKPALLARMQPIAYLPLGPDVMREIVAAKLGELKTMLSEKHGISLELSESALCRLETLSAQATSGARLIDQLIARRILPDISRAILEARLDERQITVIEIDANEEGGFVFNCAAGADGLGQVAAE